MATGLVVDRCPMGLKKDIIPGGLFLTISNEVDLTLEDLNELEQWDHNHPSFSVSHGKDRPPGLDLLSSHVELGFGELFRDLRHAEHELRARLHPAPMGTIAKAKPDGSTKFRIFQDLRRNRVNSATVITERQVLPRPLDHAVNLAQLSNYDDCSATEILILDFADAFMSVPLAECERPYNVTVLDDDIDLKRDKISGREARRGRCIAWRVLVYPPRHHLHV